VKRTNGHILFLESNCNFYPRIFSFAFCKIFCNFLIKKLSANIPRSGSWKPCQECMTTYKVAEKPVCQTDSYNKTLFPELENPVA
jgi:hypothetical protein